MSRSMRAGRMLAVLLLASVMVVASGCGGEARKARHVEQGQQFMAQHNYTKARLEFRNALQIDPKDAAVRTLLGEAAEALGYSEEAVQNYRYALVLDEGQVKARAHLARMMVFGGVPDQALELIAPGLRKNPSSADLLSVRAAAQLQQGNVDSARKDAEAALAAEPNHPDATAMMATILWRAGARDEALALLDRTIRARPDDIMLRQLYAQMLLTAEKPALAEVELKEIVRLDPGTLAHRYRLAQLYASQKKTDEAVATLREAIKAKPDEVEAKIALANLLAAQRSFEAAEKEVTAFGQDSPRDYDLQLGIGRFYEMNGRLEQAEQVYAKVVESADDRPQGITARDRIASLKIRAGKVEEASRLLDDVLKKNPADADALVMRAQIAIRRGDTNGAVTDLRAALRDQPTNLLITVQLAQAYIRSGDLTLAEQTLRSAVQANPGDVQTRLVLAQFLVNKGEPERARPVLEQLVNDNPNNVQAIEGLAKLEMALGDPKGSLQRANTIQTLQPKSASGFYLAGVAQQAQKNNDEARRAFEQALALDPNSLDALVALVRLDLAEGRQAQAQKRLDERIAQEPGNAVLLNLRGDLLASMRRWTDAIASYDAAINAQPAWPEPYRAKAAALAASGDANRAIVVLEGALGPTHDATAVVSDLGALYSLQGRSEEAIKVLEDLVVREPNNAVAANNLAMLLANSRTDAASLDRATQLTERFANVDNPMFQDTYGWVLYKRGKYAEAAEVLQKVVGRLPQEPELRYHLGMAQFKAAKPAEARRNLEAAVQGNPTYPGVEEARATLAKL